MVGSCISNVDQTLGTRLLWKVFRMTAKKTLRAKVPVPPMLFVLVVEKDFLLFCMVASLFFLGCV
jgi:hypothetical protein